MAELSDLLFLAGRMILENGGETIRVEETMIHMARAGGALSVDVFATPPGIFFSVTDDKGTYTRVVRIHQREINLAKVAEVNRVSRALVSGRLTVDEAYRELLSLERMPSQYPAWVRFLAGGIACGAFTYLLGAQWGSVFAAGIAGLTIMILVDLLERRGVTHFIAVAMGGVVAALINLIIWTLWPELDFDLAVVGSIMSLVPGVALTTSMRDALSEDLVSASVRGIEGLGVAMSIAVGVGVVLIFYLQLGGALP